MTAPSPAPTAGRLQATAGGVAAQLRWLGLLLVFVLRIVVSVPRVAVHHRREVYRLLAEITFGGGLLAVAASTVLVVGILSAALGVQIGLEGYQGLQIIGLGPLAGFLSAFGNTRELAPLITGFGLAAQVGCKFTAQLGAMRVTEEIDALEVMAIPSLPYLVTTRLLAALIAVGPLYLMALSGSYLATQFTVIAVAHQGSGTYMHYFREFLTQKDIFQSVIKVYVFAVLVTIIHCYYGFTASGGPEGVGKATGRAIRASIVTINFSDMLMTLLFWGTSSGVKVF
ncbi:MAG: ABC transporter permease [Actinomycetota bacterium]|nr:ABC transporter permease [Actinomycetota bacterium]